MFIDFAITQSASSAGAALVGKQADMPLLRSFGRLADGFYKHVAPTALRLGLRTRQVFQQPARAITVAAASWRKLTTLAESPASKPETRPGWPNRAGRLGRQRNTGRQLGLPWVGLMCLNFSCEGALLLTFTRFF